MSFQRNPETALLLVGAERLELPIVASNGRYQGIDVSKVREATGHVLVDPGAGNVSICAPSEITYLDGQEGILQYRGYRIEELANHSTFLETAYLLIYGELPTHAELQRFETAIAAAPGLPALATDSFLRSFGAAGHPMAVLQSAIAWLETQRPVLRQAESLEMEPVFFDLLRNVPALVASWYAFRTRGEWVEFDPTDGYAKGLLQAFFPDASHPQIFADVLETCLVVHADHEQNCSTNTCRSIGSAQASLYASVAGAVGALSGPLHGGANEAVVAMLEDLLASGMTVADKLAEVKSGEARLSGVGHRVYKNSDPRAERLKQLCPEVLRAAGNDSQLLDIAHQLENAVREDEYFRRRKLYPNVDFYSGILYKAMGIPVEFFTPMFAIGRLPGWIAHWVEGREKKTRIYRPFQIYDGQSERPYVPIDART
ncbi:MAG: hypothetical protein KDD69_05475 [Bdellovibrionales bacterium]|nr:hypothetical protein [Bdellovibrionales bacterium]